MRHGFPLKCHSMSPPPPSSEDHVGRTISHLLPRRALFEAVPGACAVTSHPHPAPHPLRAPALSLGFAAAAGIGRPGAGGHARAMAEGEDMQTFTSIMDALVRISVS